jgi:glycosyltransferase 2 family protein
VRAAVWKNLVMYGIGLALLGWVLYSNWWPRPGSSAPGLGEVLRRPIHIGPLLIALFIATASLFITFVRWYVLVRAQELPFSMRNGVRLGLIGYFFNTFLPGAVGGDIIKAVGIARDQSRRTVAVATVLIDRAVGLWAIFWFLALVGGTFWLAGEEVLLNNPPLLTLVRWSWGVVIASIVAWVLLGFLPERRAERFAGRLQSIRKVGGSLAEFWRAAWLYRKRPGAILAALGLSLVGHTGWVLMFHFAVQTFETSNGAQDLGTLAQHFMIVPVGLVARALIPTPGGIGGGEAVYGKLYEMIGKPASNGIMGSLAQRIVEWTLGAVGAIVFTRMRKSLPQAETPSNESAEPSLPAPSTNGHVHVPAAETETSGQR